MIIFDENILYPKDYKIDHIKVSDDLTIHYKISSAIDNSRWFIAVTLAKNGQVIPRNDLSMWFKQFSSIQSYIIKLPDLIRNGNDEITIDDKMSTELEAIIHRFETDIELLKAYREKYNI